MTSFTWIKRITGIGLCLMAPDAQRDRMDAIIPAGQGKINGPALAALIDECTASAAAFLDAYSAYNGIISAGQEDMIWEILAQTYGKQAVGNIGSGEDIAWLFELRDLVSNGGVKLEDIKSL